MLVFTWVPPLALSGKPNNLRTSRRPAGRIFVAFGRPLGHVPLRKNREFHTTLLDKDGVTEMRIRRFSWIVLMMAVVGCSGIWSRRAAAEDAPPYNIILLTPDQLRADYMHTYDYPLPDTPNMDAFASQGTVFTRAYSAGPWTTPSFGAILTGMFPTVHGMTLPPYQGCGSSIIHPMLEGGFPSLPDYLILSAHKPILPELLRVHGVTTAVDNANCWSIWDVLQRGWDQLKFFAGYESVVEGHPDLNSPFYLTAPKTLAWASNSLRRTVIGVSSFGCISWNLTHRTTLRGNTIISELLTTIPTFTTTVSPDAGNFIAWRCSEMCTPSTVSSSSMRRKSCT